MRIRSTLMISACALSVLAGCGSTDTAEPIAPSVPPLPTVSSVPRTTPAPTTTTAAPTTTTTVPPTTEPVADIAVDPDVYADVDRPYVPAPVPFVAPPPAPEQSSPSLSFSSCGAAKAAGAGPFYKDGPGYSRTLDRDGDGIACDAN